MKIIPFDPSLSSYQTFSVNLGDFVCSFRLLWNLRDACWFATLTSDAGENDGVRIVPESPLLGKKSNLGYDGDFRCLKFSKKASDAIGYSDLGSSWKLVWGSPDEWESYDG